MAPKPEPSRRIVADNRAARYHYTIEDTLEAGIALTGTEVKSLRGGKATIGEAYAGPSGGDDDGSRYGGGLGGEFGKVHALFEEGDRAREMLRAEGGLHLFTPTPAGAGLFVHEDVNSGGQGRAPAEDIWKAI